MTPYEKRSKAIDLAHEEMARYLREQARKALQKLSTFHPDIIFEWSYSMGSFSITAKGPGEECEYIYLDGVREYQVDTQTYPESYDCLHEALDLWQDAERDYGTKYVWPVLSIRSRGDHILVQE